MVTRAPPLQLLGLLIDQDQDAPAGQLHTHADTNLGTTAAAKSGYMLVCVASMNGSGR